MSELEGLMAVFHDEASESLSRLARLLLQLETASGGSAEQVREVFRLAHSLKGASSTVGRSDLTRVAHELESCLDQLRRGQRAASKQLIDAALSAVDLLTVGLGRTLEPEDIERARQALASTEPLLPQAPAQAAQATAHRSLTELIDALLPALAEAHRAPSGRSAASALLSELEARPEAVRAGRAPGVLGRMRRLVESQTDDPDLARRRFEALVQAADFVQVELLEGASDEEARAVVEVLSGVLHQHPAPLAPAIAPVEESLRVPVALLDAILYRVDELVATKLRLDHARQSVEALQVLVERKSVDLSGRAVELRRRLEALHGTLAEEAHGLGLLTQGLQDDVRDVRMVQIAPLLEPFRRTARDVASLLQKRVRLEIEGEVRVDKRLFDLAKDPLSHLLRNAIDHGLEVPALRLAAGKDEVGTVRIIATSQDSQLILEVSDDGAGINLEAVKKVARARGLLASGAELEQRDALELIFQPGFSTTAQATAISGRGVGLDVVRTNVARLGGTVEISTRPGAGSRFVLALPLTLAAAGGLFVRVGRNVYCLPLAAVEEVRLLEVAEVGASRGQLFARLERVAPWAALGDVLAGRPAAAPRRATACVILAVGELRAALGVDELIGQQEVVVKALAPGTPRLLLVAGATSLADGTLVCVLEPAAVLAAMPTAAEVNATAPPARARLLVVDDTLTTRTMVASVLERAGYEVLVAADGEAAWARLAHQPVRLVVSDVDMPVLDGLGLTRRLRGSSAHRQLPVVLLSSLGSAADQAQGAEAGATAYVVKTDFDPAAFLGLISSLLNEEPSK